MVFDCNFLFKVNFISKFEKGCILDIENYEN